MPINVGVFFGGKSVEHEISIISAIQAINSFDREKYTVIPIYIAKDGVMYAGDEIGNIESYKNVTALLAKSQRVICVQKDTRLSLVKYPLKRIGNSIYNTIDFAFPIVHGTNVEDGALQGFFKTMSIPYAGCDVTASAVGMDKYIMKTILQNEDIPVLKCKRIYVKNYYLDKPKTTADIEQMFSYPVIIKPLNLGSSIGIKKAGNTTELHEALEYAFQYTDMAVIERAIVNLREINCAVLGDRESVLVSECEEPVTTDEILSYNDKYIGGDKTGTKGMSSLKRILPAGISPQQRETIRSLAQKTFQALGCNGVARIDFLMDCETDRIWVNEINTIPGSLSFYLWEPIGITYSELLDRIIELSLKRERENNEISYSFETNILSNFSAHGSKGVK